MSHLPQILVALLAQAAGDAGFVLPIEAPWIAPLLVSLPYALAALVRTLFLRGRFRAAERVDLAQRWSGNLAHGLLVLCLGFGASVARWTGSQSSDGWPSFDLLLQLAPFVAYEFASIDARARLVAVGTERASIRRFQARMFVATLLPIVLYVGAAALLGLVEPLRVRVEEIALVRALFGALLLASLALLLPMLLRRTWETEPMPAGPSRDLLLSVARLARFERPRLLVWRTGNTMANAAIVGLTPWSRVVLFSDSLLAQMAPNELAAVFAHEMGHAFRWHVPIFAAWTLAILLGAEYAASLWFSNSELASGAVLAGGALLWLVSFGWMSRRFELEADLFSLDLLGETRSLVSALERVGGRLRDIAGWRHFSTADRVRFLEDAQADPRVGERLRRNLRRVAWCGALLLALVVGLQLRSAWRTFEIDSARADLRLGRYESAVARAVAKSDGDASFAAWIERARGLRDGTGVEELRANASAAEARGDGSQAREWYELAGLRGDVAARERARELATPTKK